MALTAGLTTGQSSSGKVETYNDQSNWVAEAIDPSTYTRTVEIYDGVDATGTLVTTLTFSGSNLTVSRTISEDKATSAKYTATNGSTTVTDTINFLPTQFEKNKIAQGADSCGCKSNSNVYGGFMFMTLAQWATELGNFPKANTYLDASNTLLNG